MEDLSLKCFLCSHPPAIKNPYSMRSSVLNVSTSIIISILLLWNKQKHFLPSHVLYLSWPLIRLLMFSDYLCLIVQHVDSLVPILKIMMRNYFYSMLQTTSLI